MNDIIFNRGRGGLGRALPGKDHVSGLVVEMADVNIPTELVSAELYAVLYSVEDATDLGIKYTESQTNLEQDTLKYTIDRIFEANSKAIVHLVIADSTASKTVATELITLQAKAQGEVRQALLLAAGKTFAVGDLIPIQTSCDFLEASHQPLSVIYAPDMIVADLGDADLRALDYKNISVCAAMDGSGIGDALYTAYSQTITAGGAMLGALSLAKVNENIAWIGKFNLNKNATNEFDALRLADGRLLSSISSTEIEIIDSKGYVFLEKHVGKAGSYFNDTHTATALSSDYAYIENNRTIDKAVRDCRVFLLPNLNSPLYVNEDGTLTEDTIAGFKNDAEQALEEMERNAEISTYKVTIDPDQDVLSTSKVSVTIEIVPVGVGRNIRVNIGLTVRVTNA